MAKLQENRYGKSRVRLVRVKRHGSINDFHEWSVEVLLRGEQQVRQPPAEVALPTATIVAFSQPTP